MQQRRQHVTHCGQARAMHVASPIKLAREGPNVCAHRNQFDVMRLRKLLSRGAHSVKQVVIVQRHVQTVPQH